jgi:purine-nucleoside phosphorylase
MNEKLKSAVRFIQAAFPGPPARLALILGSGLGGLGDELEQPRIVETFEIPHWPVSTVPGHKGRLVSGLMEGISVLIMQGRVHFYEGYAIQDVVFPVRVFGMLGIQTLVLTNAAGGINPGLKPGDLMLITDHINSMGTNPLIGPHDPEWGPRFPDMSSIYHSDCSAAAEEAAAELGIRLTRGVLAATTGPSYETAAEIRMLAKLGADAVTMSTIPEAIAASQMGMRVLGISFISNYATGISGSRLSHEEVENTAQKHRDRFKALVRETVVRLAGRKR